jgi:hypothetical protein
VVLLVVFSRAVLFDEPYGLFLLSAVGVAGLAGHLVGRWKLPLAVVALAVSLAIAELLSAPDPVGEDQRVLTALTIGVDLLALAFVCAVGTGIRKRQDAKLRRTPPC